VDAKNGIWLSDGTSLFEYDPWGVYAGWAVSSVTALGLLAVWLVHLPRGRRADG
jgi:hypothetical protein